MPDQIILLLHSALSLQCLHFQPIRPKLRMSRLVGRKLQGTLGAHAASGLEAVPRYARRQKSLLGQGGGFWNYRWRSITDGGQSPPSVMFAIPITSAVCCSLNFRELLLLNPLIAGLGGQVISNQRFCLRRRNLRSWEKPLCFRTGCIQASKRSSIFSVRTALHHRRARAPRNP